MAFDGLVVRAVVRELQSLVGGRLHKIHQPNEYDLVFAIRAQGATTKLLLSANPTYPRFHLTGRSYPNPLEAPMFCMLLRKHCENGVVESIVQLGAERIVHLNIRQRDELGDVSARRIVFELMGRHSNIILLDPESNLVIEAARRVTPAISSYRIVAPGSAYTPPPDQAKRNPLEASRQDIAETLSPAGAGQAPEPATGAAPRDGTRTPAERLVAAFAGISPLAAKAIVREAAKAPDGSIRPDAAVDAFAAAMSRMRNHAYVPNIVTDRASGKSSFAVVPLPAEPADGRETFDSVSACLERYYGDKAERDWVRQQTSDLLRLLQNETSKNEKKLEKLDETIAEAKEADKYRMMGELLNASLHTIERGADRTEVVNYYDERQRTVTVPLEPTLTPSENAQRYFRKYQKMKNSLPAVEEQLRETRHEIRYLETLLQQLEDAGPEDIEDIRAELTEGGYVRDRGPKHGKKAKKRDKLRLGGYLSTEGVPIYVGRNNAQNDFLTSRLAHPTDVWLHTKDIPGSHVVIRAGSFNETTLEEAAILAAYYSKAKQSSGVPVDYTFVKHVRKPSGAKPGFVIYDRQKTLYVTPDEDRIRRMQPLKGAT